jgi:hypothetical protein
MSKIFVRERRHAGPGAGRPRFAIVAVQGTDLKVFQPHVRRAELEMIAASIEADIVYLPRGRHAREEENEPGRARRHRQEGQDAE